MQVSDRLRVRPRALLAIINAVFAPAGRAAAIAAYLGAGHALTVFQPALGSWLATHYGWRTCFLVTPVLAALTLVITLKFVPETVRDQRKLDIIGILLIAAALVTTIYGLTELQGGLNVGALGLIGLGLALGWRSCGGNCTPVLPPWICASSDPAASTPR